MTGKTVTKEEIEAVTEENIADVSGKVFEFLQQASAMNYPLAMTAAFTVAYALAKGANMSVAEMASFLATMDQSRA